MTSYTTRQGDTWDLIAKRLFASESYMGKLIQANLSHRKTVIFSAGVVLNVPDIDTEANLVASDLPIWKRGKSS